jgi:hypothetical protein
MIRELRNNIMGLKYINSLMRIRDGTKFGSEINNLGRATLGNANRRKGGGRGDTKKRRGGGGEGIEVLTSAELGGRLGGSDKCQWRDWL